MQRQKNVHAYWPRSTGDMIPPSGTSDKPRKRYLASSFRVATVATVRTADPRAARGAVHIEQPYHAGDTSRSSSTSDESRKKYRASSCRIATVCDISTMHMANDRGTQATGSIRAARPTASTLVGGRTQPGPLREQVLVIESSRSFRSRPCSEAEQPHDRSGDRGSGPARCACAGVARGWWWPVSTRSHPGGW
jgi:hypothetical protein